MQTIIVCQKLHQVNIKHYGRLNMIYLKIKYVYAIFSILIHVVITLIDALSYDKQCIIMDLIVSDCLVISYKLIFSLHLREEFKIKSINRDYTRKLQYTYGMAYKRH